MAPLRLEWEDRGLGAERKSVQDECENLLPNSNTCESEPEHNRLLERPREVLMHRAEKQSPMEDGVKPHHMAT